MTDHYYNSNLDTKSNLKEFKIKIFTNELTFLTDHGVFSKATVDYGTLTLLSALKINQQTKKILDVGCGYGPIGISLAKEFSQLEVDMIDVNLRAIELTRKNLQKNGINNAKVFKSNMYENINSTYDCILTNPPIRAGKDVVHQILTSSIDYLNDQGELFVVIQKKQGAPSAKEKMEQVFGNCDIIKRDKGYYVLKSIKK